MTKNKRGALFIILSALGFGSYGVWSRLIGDSFGVFYQSWTRALLIVIVIFPILYYTKQIVPIKRSDWRWMFIFLFSTIFTQAPVFYAFNHMDIGTATLLFFTSTLLTMYMVGFFVLKEKLSSIKLISFILAVFGLYITFSFSLVTFAFFAAMMAVLNGTASGTELSSSKKLTTSYSALYITWLSWVSIIITNSIFSLVAGETQHVPTFSVAWVYLVGFAICSILSFWLAIEGLKYIESSIGGLIGLLEIVFSIGFGIFIFNESLAPNIIIGGLLIISAAAAASCRITCF